jgi:hypothetical protein
LGFIVAYTFFFLNFDSTALEKPEGLIFSLSGLGFLKKLDFFIGFDNSWELQFIDFRPKIDLHGFRVLSSGGKQTELVILTFFIYL